MACAAPSDSLSTLYRDHHGWLAGWLRRKLGNGHDAADLAHDTFLRILAARNAAAIEEPRKYLATIAKGLVVDRFRRQSIEAAWLETLAARPEPLAISPETRALILETLLAIDRMLDELGPRAREIFLLAQFEGLTYAAIGERLGVSVTTVKKHLARALAHCLILAEGC
ncbi:RNA polymerase sigma-70 factor (ECF subfamily) [Azonexus fungiphilus]|uniref:RNA polymerase sigma-70 factor (ECF subfamily) n=1 Tax=Azonexus fungiphilus TaxID=146940 RepID=A0A495VMK9_9RHOO|nr:sigma-70 family RNA polymerase sigma factor [Azonexus fungiphilus]NHC07649.1 sigma-70 family RNA polymerase sigma factor [Azonexus fungiphilus]RKT49653.1 RNA polymerase sigma-70 factor (ECF subfamily) [Azonexus fungiphilus]